MAIESTPKTRGPNLDPKSSVLSVDVRDFDCSALSPRPRDGEWLNCLAERGGAATRTVAGPGSRAVWGIYGRPDIQALGWTKVPVIFSRAYAARFHMWRSPAVDMDAAKTAMAPGALLTITVRTTAPIGAYVLSEATTVGTADIWLVGYTTKAPTSQEDYVGAYIYDSPRLITIS